MTHSGPSFAIIVNEPSRKLEPLGIRELWKFREILYFLVMRDIKVRYRQTILGIGWAILQPLATMLAMTFVFHRVGQVQSGHVAYPVFAFTALLPWQLFANCLSRTSQSVVGEQHLVTKIYFPRLILPMAALGSSLLDFCMGFLVLLGLMLWYRVSPTIHLLALPAVMALAMLTALSLGIWIAALNTKFRDFGHVVPLVLQVWLFISPIAYPSTLLTNNFPKAVQFLYHINPIALVADSARWVVLEYEFPPLVPSVIAVAIIIVLLIGGMYYYKKLADVFADFV